MKNHPSLKLNNKGAILIIAYFVMFILVTLSVSLALSTFTELNNSRRYRDLTLAFWLAEAGANQFVKNTSLLDDEETKVVSYGNGTIQFKRDDTHSSMRLVTVTGMMGGSKRSIQLEYPSIAPGVFNNTVSVNGNVEIKGSKSTLAVNGRIRLSGKVKDVSKHSIAYFDDKKENISPQQVSLVYPDANGDGVRDGFSDFVATNRRIIANYNPDEVVYIQGNDTYTIVPNKSLVNKKIIYIEGNEGKGNVVVQFDSAWADNQSLTIISTGTVTYNQAGLEGDNSQVNIIAWGNYYETAALPCSHNGLIYTHAVAHFDEIHDTSITNGIVIANEGMTINEVWSTKTFNYKDPRTDGVVPPGFEGLIDIGSTNKYAESPSSWKEIY